MKLVLAAMVGAMACLADVAEGPAQPTELNVNSRYTVESVVLSPRPDYPLSSSLREEIQRAVGERFNPEALNRLSREVMAELRARNVSVRLSRGLAPARVRVTLEVERQDTNFDVSLSRLVYQSGEGWSGSGQATATFGKNALSATGVSNGDDLVERYSGIRARYDRFSVGSDRIRLGFEFDLFREQYDSATIQSLSTSSSLGAGAYSSRMSFEPSATFVLARPLTLTVGMSFDRMEPQGGGAPELANSFTDSLLYRQQWGATEGNSEELEAGYRMRVGSRLLGSGSQYKKHTANLKYKVRRNHQLVQVSVMAGVIYGQAPLFEYFVLGNSTTLRGWNKFDLDPLGGNRVAEASVTYGYHIFRVFYDTGAVWDRGQAAEEKHSVGTGLTTGLGRFTKDAVLLAVAFPVRQGHVLPVFIAGMNF